MGRRNGFVGLINAMARESARQARMAEAQRKRQERMSFMAEREAQRSLVLAEKEARFEYLEERNAEVEDLNTELVERIEQLTSVLSHTLNINDLITFDSLRIKDKFKTFKAPKDLADKSPEPRKEDFLSKVKAPGLVGKLVPGSEKRYNDAVEDAEKKFSKTYEEYEELERARTIELQKIKDEYEKEKQGFELKVQQRNQEVDEFEASYKMGEREAVITYNSMVLERSEYPDGFPQEFRITYGVESNELVIDYELPSKDVVPRVAEYRYVKSKDEITEKPRKIAEIKQLYQDVVASVALRSIHEVLEADQGNIAQVVVFNGFVNTTDPATGREISPYLLSVRVTKETFNQLDLSKIDKLICLKNLGAQVSAGPAELQPVKPIINFDMVDKRFVDHDDILGALDVTPNLMDLNPYEFENLVTNLFEKMGLEAKLTRSSKDGGVDSVAYDTRPVVGGKVVIQAKRYKNTVGVSAVRDLYGTMMNEGANKGILVTTSGYGPDAFDFSKDKPIELIDGGGLLYLLGQNGIKAKIIFPEAI